jgi:transcriptional regulator with XRE-family HTH domain
MARKPKRPPTAIEQLLGAIDGSGLSGRALGRKAGVSQSSISRLRRGERSLLLVTAELLAGALDMRIALVPSGKQPERN